MVDHFALSRNAAAFVQANSRNVRAGVPVVFSTVLSGRDPLPDATVSVSQRRTVP